MQKKDGIKRRAVLKQAGAATISAGILSGTAAGAPEEGNLEARYGDTSSLLGAFRTHGADLVTALADEGFVGEDFGYGDLDPTFDSTARGMEPTDADGRAGVTTTTALGPRTALGMLSMSTDDHHIALYVQPQRGRSYAVVEPKSDGGARHLVTDRGTSTMMACTGSDCTCERCDCPNNYSFCYQREYWECSDRSCQDCYVTDTECDEDCDCD